MNGTDRLARVVAVQEGLVTLAREPGSDLALTRNEVVRIRPGGREDVRLQGEVLHIRGDEAVAQVFESTHGIAVGDPVELTGEQLSVTLGPGLLGSIFDGLQNPLEALAARHGVFLPAGAEEPALDRVVQWTFTPRVRIGDRVRGGSVLGLVQEGPLEHRLTAPVDLEGEGEVSWVQQGPVTVEMPVVRLVDGAGREHPVALARRWPVRRPYGAELLRARVCERLYPEEPLITTQRIIDTFFPVARGGTACIPGPFGAGKTVLQNLVARYSNVDVVIVVACGERAGEVVETITEFPQLSNPTGTGSLMDRTIIVCNTSSMPVAAREASMYTGVTLGEYYRQLGHDVLLIADSTSRWAQAMRETSGRMEEIPGDEAFPAYLDSTIRALYERSGVIRGPDGDTGSLTLIGTVSPAGGNFEEPVTQITLATVKAFLGLSADRAYKRFYPAIDPLLSWSRYRDQLAGWYDARLGPAWRRRVERLRELLVRGDRVAQMMEVTGEEGVTLEQFVVHLLARFVDDVYLQQDAFDPVDASASLERQQELLALVARVTETPRSFPDRDAARHFHTRLTELVKNLNYARSGSQQYTRLALEIDALLGDGAAREPEAEA